MIKIQQQSEIVQKLCGNCALRALCMPIGLNDKDLDSLQTIIHQSRRLKKGEYLFHSGDHFDSIFAVRTGFFKTLIASVDGRDQVTGFFMSGEILGLDGICQSIHNCDSVALEDSEVCELPFESLLELGKKAPELQTDFYKLMSQEIVREQWQMLMLGNMCAEERLAIFLMNLSARLRKRGFAANNFILRMSREAIGSYLGLKLETVSRTLSKFQQEGWIRVKHKHIELIRPEELILLTHRCLHIC